jgi:uncharacterized Zn-binding protein involved in type VI secretion
VNLAIAVVGDTTSGGGSILEGEPRYSVHGVPAAHVGSAVLCGACGPTHIASSDSRITIWGKKIARHGDPLACGHTVVVMERRGHSEGGPDAKAARTAPAAGARGQAGGAPSVGAPAGGMAAASSRHHGSVAAPETVESDYTASILWVNADGDVHAGLDYLKCIEGQSPVSGTSDHTGESTVVGHYDPADLVVVFSIPPIKVN